MAATLFEFRRGTAGALCVLLFFAVFAFGAIDEWAFAAVACGVFGLAALWAWRMARNPYPVVLTWFYLPLGLIVAGGLAQAALGLTASPHDTQGALGWWLLYVVYFALAVNVLDDVTLRRSMQRRLAYLGGCVSMAAVAQRLISPRAVYGARTTPGAPIFGPFVNAEYFAFLIALILPGALLLAFRDSGRKLPLLASCVAMAGAVGVSGSRAGRVIVAGEIILALGAAAYLAARSMSRRNWGRRGLLTAAGALSVAVLVAVGFGSDVRRRAAPAVESFQPQGTTALTRTDVLETSWELLRQKPALGHGLGAFGAVFGVSAPRRDGFHWEHAQSDPVELAVELGAVGIAAQALLLAMILVGRGRDLRTWIGLVLPLAAVWGYSWVSSPLRTPALALVALTILAVLASGRNPLARAAG